MPVHEQVYLTCSVCGEVYSDTNWDVPQTEYAETANEIRGLAEDDGWRIDYDRGLDCCPKCLKKEPAHA